MDRLTGAFKGVSMFATVEQARIYNKLRQYEDTGLTPDEITALRDENERTYSALKLAQARAADYEADIEAGRLVRLRDCDECRFKLQSDSWRYYTYPCNECRQRTKDHFTYAALGRDAE